VAKEQGVFTPRETAEWERGMAAQIASGRLIQTMRHRGEARLWSNPKNNHWCRKTISRHFACHVKIH
jgi:hypothetical protein